MAHAARTRAYGIAGAMGPSPDLTMRCRQPQPKCVAPAARLRCIKLIRSPSRRSM
jgi:hypothetical protein